MSLFSIHILVLLIAPTIFVFGVPSASILMPGGYLTVFLIVGYFFSIFKLTRRTAGDSSTRRLMAIALGLLLFGDIQFHLYHYFGFLRSSSFELYSYSIIHTPFVLAQFMILAFLWKIIGGHRKVILNSSSPYIFAGFLAILSVVIANYHPDQGDPVNTALYFLQASTGLSILGLSIFLFIKNSEKYWTLLFSGLIIMWAVANQLSWLTFAGYEVSLSISEFVWAFGQCIVTLSVVYFDNSTKLNLSKGRSLTGYIRSSFVFATSLVLLMSFLISENFEYKWFWFVLIWSFSFLISGIISLQLKRQMDTFLRGLRSLINGKSECEGSLDESTQHILPEIRETYEELFEAHMMEIKETEMTEAIAQTSQMLAHDAKKPFTQLIKIMDLMEGETGEEIERMAKELFPQVRKSLKSVNSMIQDIKEVGSDAHPVCRDENIEEMIDAAITENLKYRDSANIDLSYDFRHSLKISVDQHKMMRVFSNIIGNALQAMKSKGTISFSTVSRDGEMLLTIRNSGSFIPAVKLSPIFDAFFTEGKRGGTGLGLAIAKKVIEAHKGTIWCDSSENEGTSFHMTIPCSNTPSNYLGTLPGSAEDVRGETLKLESKGILTSGLDIKNPAKEKA
jgi:signal transduction histidine kinase